jgi:hypothetical protein
MLAVLSLIIDTMPLRTVILFDGRASRTLVWATPGTEDEAIEFAKQHARRAIAAIVHRDEGSLSFEDEGASRALPQLPARENGAVPGFLLLPLVDNVGDAFGALQLETFGVVHEEDANFAGAVATQLGKSLGRVGSSSPSAEPMALVAATKELAGD